MKILTERLNGFLVQKDSLSKEDQLEILNRELPEWIKMARDMERAITSLTSSIEFFMSEVGNILDNDEISDIYEEPEK